MLATVASTQGPTTDILFVFACSHQNIYLSIPFEIKNKDWAKLARVSKNTHRCEAILSCFYVFAYLNIYQNINSFVAFESREKKTELNELQCSKTPSQMSSFAHKHVSVYLHAQTNKNTLLDWSYTKS